MSLRSKILLLLSLVVLAYAGLDHVMQRKWVFESFVQLERSVVQKDVARVSDAIQAEIDTLSRDCTIWAASDKLRHLATSADPQDFTRAFPDAMFDSNTLHVVCICDSKGRILRSRVRDWDRGVDVVMSGFRIGDNLVKEALVSSERQPVAVKGLLDSERSLLLVASNPIHASGAEPRSQPPIGTLVVGRFLGAIDDVLSARVGVGFEASSARQQESGSVREQYFKEAARASGPVLVEVHDDRLDAYWCMSDVRGKPSAFLRAGFARDISAQGDVAVRYALVSTVAAGVLLMLVLLCLVQRMVLNPLRHLTEYAVNVGRSEDFTKRIRSDREDEVGILAREFDSMIERVAESRAALVETARAAGMSEIATGVLHNVGNVLNSVNVSARIAVEKAKGTSTSDLKKVMETLRPNAHDLTSFIQSDPRGKHLYPLLDSLSDKIADERKILVHELEALTDGIEHIKELVQSQQGYAGRAGVRETVSLADQVESAISITSQATSTSAAIQIVRDFEDIDSVSVDRHKLMEILVNLIQNARQAVTESQARPMRVTVRLKKLPHQRIRIEVADNGVGIAPENVARVFTHGFTTKKNGHGFGLHASANAATEMGGSLSAHSDGKGLGATFALELPLMVPATTRVSS